MKKVKISKKALAVILAAVLVLSSFPVFSLVTVAKRGSITCPTSKGFRNVSTGCETCPQCEGNGTVENACTACGGSGKTSNSCTDCGGSGQIPYFPDCYYCGATGRERNACTYCGGSGYFVSVPCIECSGAGYFYTGNDCEKCGGSGKLYSTLHCTVCHGTGTVETDCTECSGNGKVQSTCSMCQGTGTISTQDDDSFTFSNPSPGTIFVGDAFTNPAFSGLNLTGDVTYSSSNDSIASVDDSGTVTAHKAGIVTITAKIETDYIYSSKEISYQLEINKYRPQIESYQISPINYGQSLQDADFISVLAKAGDENVSGSARWDNESETPSVTDSGQTTYKAIFTPDDTDVYETVEFRATVTVNPVDITGVSVTGLDETYSGEPFSAVEVTGTINGDSITYSTDGVNYSSSMPTLTDVADSTTVYVKVVRNENYNELVLTAQASVSPKELGEFKLDAYNGTYDSEYHKAVDISALSPTEQSYIDHFEYGGQIFDDVPEFMHAGNYDVTVVLKDNFVLNGEKEIPLQVVIEKKDVTVYTADRVVAYDGKTYSAIADEASADLCGADVLESCEPDGEFSEIGEYNINVKNALITREGYDVTGDYNITYQAGLLTIAEIVEPAPDDDTSTDGDITTGNTPEVISSKDTAMQTDKTAQSNNTSVENTTSPITGDSHFMAIVAAGAVIVFLMSLAHKKKTNKK